MVVGCSQTKPFSKGKQYPIQSEYKRIKKCIQVIPFKYEEKEKKLNIQYWESYEDEYISFYYPKHPSITLEVKDNTPDKKNVVLPGGAASSSKNTYRRWYHLKYKEEDYCMILLDEQKEFDDGICLCGAVAFEKYMFHNGGLYRISLIGFNDNNSGILHREDGRIKKIQVLKGQHRIVFIESTHSAISQENYLKIALSLKIKDVPCNKQEMMEYIKNKYGFVGKAGFLRKGLSQKDVMYALNIPTNETEKYLEYIWEDKNGKYITRLYFVDNKFIGYSSCQWYEEIK